MKIFAFTLLLLSISVSSFSQDRFFNTTNRKDVDYVLNEVLSNTKNKYNQVKIDSLRYENVIEFHYSDGEHQLYVEFNKNEKGGNKDLGIPDTLKYSFSALRGFYQDVFPFWKKYYEPEADYVQTAMTKHGKPNASELPTKRVAAFYKNAEEWILIIRHF
ncbi:MAG: hypothetical protein QM768_21730 [Agriterribacter sp.]